MEAYYARQFRAAACKFQYRCATEAVAYGSGPLLVGQFMFFQDIERCVDAGAEQFSVRLVFACKLAGLCRIFRPQALSVDVSSKGNIPELRKLISTLLCIRAEPHPLVYNEHPRPFAFYRIVIDEISFHDSVTIPVFNSFGTERRMAGGYQRGEDEEGNECGNDMSHDWPPFSDVVHMYIIMLLKPYVNKKCCLAVGICYSTRMGQKCVSAVVCSLALVLPWFTAHAGDSSVPAFRDEDLNQYKGSNQTLPLQGAGASPDTGTSKDKITIFKENDRSVAAVTAYDEKGKAFSHGSGFVYGEDGLVLTSYHVLSNATSAKVKVGGIVFPVEGVLFMDREDDIVILKAGGAGLRAVQPGDSRSIRAGDMAYLIDNPQGKENRITEGKVTGFRDVGGKRMIQLSVPFSAGSSGGPVFNEQGEVIGIAAMVVNDGKPVSFAVPIHRVKERYSGSTIISLQDALYRDRKQSADYWIAVADGHTTAGRHQEAITAYKQALDADPDSAIAYNGLGMVYTGLKQFSEALDAFKRALRLDPASAWTYSNLGLVYIEMKMFSDAIEALRQAIKIMPDLSVAHFNLGIAYAGVERYRAAETSYREAIRLAPSFADAQYGLGLVYLYLHDRNAARRQYEILQGLDPVKAGKLWDKIRE